MDGISPLRRSTGQIGRLAALGSVLACVAAVLSGALQWYMTVNPPVVAAVSSVGTPASSDKAASAWADPGTLEQTAPRVGQGPQWALRSERSETPDAGAAHLTTESTSAAPDGDPASPAPRPVPPVAGVWASHISGCSPHENRQGLLPAVISPEGAWAGETTCAFKNRKENERGWEVVATCSNTREKWTAKVRLTVNGDRLTWSSRRGTQAYLRCDAGVRFAESRSGPR